MITPTDVHRLVLSQTGVDRLKRRPVKRDLTVFVSFWQSLEMFPCTLTRTILWRNAVNVRGRLCAVVRWPDRVRHRACERVLTFTVKAARRASKNSPLCALSHTGAASARRSVL